MRKVSWKFIWHVLWVTAAFHAAAWSLISIGQWKAIWSPPSPVTDLGGLLLVVAITLLPYWSVFILAAISREAEPIHRWRFWGAWVVVTAPLACFYLAVMLGADHGFGLAFVGLLYVLIPGSIIATLIGALAGDLLFRFYRMRANRLARSS